jgi:hypothetical protein
MEQQKTAWTIVRDMVDDIAREPRYEDKSVGFIEAGTTDSYKHIAKGGFWNDRSGRATDGFTKADVDTVRRELKAIGVKMTFDEADAIIMQAVRGVLTFADMKQYGPVGKGASAAERKRRQRDRAREAGLCLMNPHHGPAGEGYVTCPRCRK